MCQSGLLSLRACSLNAEINSGQKRCKEAADGFDEAGAIISLNHDAQTQTLSLPAAFHAQHLRPLAVDPTLTIMLALVIALLALEHA